MKQLIEKLLNQTSYVKNLHEQVQRQGKYPAGHYYSPIPSTGELDAYVDSRKTSNHHINGIEMHEQEQHDLLAEYATFYAELPFPKKSDGGASLLLSEYMVQLLRCYFFI